MDVLTCHCHPLWWELWVFLWICCNLLAGQELPFSYTSAFLSVGFLKVFILKTEVSFLISSGCSHSWSWKHLLTFCPLPSTALQFAFPPVASLARDLWVSHGHCSSPLWNHSPACISFPRSPQPLLPIYWRLCGPHLAPESHPWVSGGWHAWLRRCRWEDPVIHLQCPAFEEACCVWRDKADG